jgi:DNA segregation ATPase FtsK/SpoIIIE-like protein
MNRVTRRKLIVLAGVALACTAAMRVRAGPARVGVKSLVGTGPASSVAAIETQATAADLAPLLEQVAEWIDQLRDRGQSTLLSPVGHVQREFRLGYNRTCALIDELARRGEWTIAFDGDGHRYARIHPKVAG